MSESNLSLTILVVEDNPGDLFLLEELLRGTSLSVRQLLKVTNAAEAQKVLQQEDVNLVLLDLSLPDSTGLDSYDLINEHASSIPVIVLTGLMDTEIALETMAGGAQDYLIKGEFDEKLLEKTIQYSIERKKSLEILRESHERFRYVTRATNDVIWDMNLQTMQIRWAGENLKKLFGYELPNDESDFSFWRDHIHPDERDVVTRQLWETCEAANVDLWADEYRFIRADGSIAYVLDKCLLQQDHVTGW